MKRRLLLAFLIAGGGFLIVVGVVFSPDFVARYIKHVEALHPITEAKVLSYQLYTITAGFLLVLLSVFLYSRRYVKILFLPLIIAYVALAYTSYIDKRYPENTFLKPDEFKKFWYVLLGKELFLSDYKPRSTLVLANHEVNRARYPVINVHTHQTYWIEKLSPEEVSRIMDNCGVEVVVDLDGGPNDFRPKMESYKNGYSDRFILFYQVVFPDGTIKDSFFPKAVNDLEEAVKMGAGGLKIWKRLGLMTRDSSGKVIPVDDPRLDPLWAKAGELGIPVLIHIADPDAFFLPIDRFNERFEQLQLGDFTGFYKPIFPRKEEIVKQFENVLRKHPDTVFIGAHMLMLAENLGYLGSLLDKYPNLYVDLSAQVPELGRQPYTAREFFIRYQDRVLFGTDGNPREGDYRDHFRFLETSDEYFDYPFSKIHSFGRWKIYGLYLPDEVLEKIYYKNAKKLLHY